QDPHQEVLGGGAEVPAAEARAQAQAGLLRVGREVLDRVAAVQAEAHHEAPLGGEVRGEAGERGAALRGGEEGQHVPGADGEVELRGQLQLGEVPHLPARLGVVRAGDLDEVRVQVHARHRVPGAGEVAADAPAAAAGVEDPGSAPGHRVEQPGLAVDVLPGGLEASPALRVAAGVLGI